MIFLIVEILGFLLLALLAGVAAGWLLRDLVSSKREESAQRAMVETRARVPQLEAQVRAREQQLGTVQEQLAQRDEQIQSLQDVVKEKEAELRAKVRELKASNRDSATLAFEEDAASGGSPAEAPLAQSERLRGLETEAAELRRALAEAQAELAARPGADAAGADPGALTAAQAELEALQGVLERERRRVAELERERELQNQSLKLLHQQLELGRDAGDDDHRQAG